MNQLSSTTRKPKALPLIYHWRQATDPIPVRPIRQIAIDTKLSRLESAPPWYVTGDPGQPFHFTRHMEPLVADIVSRMAEFRHIDPKRILIGLTQARDSRVHGLQARVTPLRFAGGQFVTCHEGVHYQVQRYARDEIEYLYLMTFCLPRFCNQDFENKLITIFHELYHIGEKFDGDLRRYPGTDAHHPEGMEDYDARMAEMAREYLSTSPSMDLFSFLRLTFAQLESRHGSVIGCCPPHPQMIPVESPPREAEQSFGLDVEDTKH